MFAFLPREWKYFIIKLVKGGEVKIVSVAAHCNEETAVLKGFGGLKPVISASLKGSSQMGLYNWLYLVSGPSTCLHGTS